MSSLVYDELRLRLADVKSNFTLLHVGCGSGELIGELLALPHVDRMVGIDLRQHLIARAADSQSDKRIEFRHQSFRDFESTFNFDLILVSAPSTHFSDLSSGFIKCYFLLREKGSLILHPQSGGNFDQKLWRSELEDCGFEFVRFSGIEAQSEPLIIASKSAINRTAYS